MKKSEESLAAGLLDVQAKAQALFAATETQNLIRPGAGSVRRRDASRLQIKRRVVTSCIEYYGHAAMHLSRHRILRGSLKEWFWLRC
jgi:hypothetical protein